MPRLGVDANGGLDYARVAAAGRTFAVRYHSDDGYPRNLTRAEADDAASHGVDLVSVWQNAGSEEIWLGRPGAIAGYKCGRACAEIARDQQRECGGAGKPVYFAADKRTSIDGRDSSWKIGPVLAFLRGARSVIGKDRVGVYGTRYTVAQALAAGDTRYLWQTYLHDGIYDGGAASPLHPSAHLLQYANADRTGKDHFGAESVGSYMAYDRAFAGSFGQWRPA